MTRLLIDAFRRVQSTFPLLAGIGILLGAAGCGPDVREGAFSCDPELPGTCPPGYYCQLRGGSQEHRCYAEAAGFCGDGVRDPGEECDGLEIGDATCRTEGLLTGTLGCGETCLLDTSSCRRAVQVAVGMNLVCGLDDAGTVWCWGNTVDKGRDRALPLHLPTRVPGLPPLLSIAAGGSHACGLDVEARAWCWGANEWGQLGNGAVRYVSESVWDPTEVQGNRRWQRLALGRTHSCGLDDEGTLWCWGLNDKRQVEDREVDGSAVPVPSGPPVTFVEVAAGGAVTCGLDTEGRTWCWGDNLTGQLASADPGVHGPVEIPTSDGSFVRLAVSGSHVCALDTYGAPWCWGWNTAAQAGSNDEAIRFVPGRVPGTERFETISAGTAHTCAASAEGEVHCWGFHAATDGVEHSAEPVPLGDGPFHSLSSGGGASCGVVPGTGRIRCWGHNGVAKLGIPTGNTEPRPVLTNTPLESLALSWPTTCGLDAQGLSWCWGHPAFSGTGSLSLVLEAARTAAASPMTQISGGLAHFCGLTTEGEALCWGDNSNNQLGVGSAPLYLLPTPVLTSERFASLSAGAVHTCALTVDGALWCWGGNFEGQLGAGDAAPRATPVHIADGFSKIAAGSVHTCALDDTGPEGSGLAWCWGFGSAGRTGINSPVNATTYEPTRVASEQYFIDIFAGNEQSCALDREHRAWCWGDNRQGAVGDGGQVGGDFRGFPVPVAGDHSFIQLALGYAHTCGLDDQGRAWCWGENMYGQLGDGTRVSQWSPVSVSGGHVFASIASGNYADHTCGVTEEDRRVLCWGANAEGQLGTEAYHRVPVEVVEPLWE